jgi:pre-mRNA-splicing helicase BRR2
VAAVLRVRKEGLFFFDQSYRPIPLEQRYIGITEKKGVRKMLLLNEILYDDHKCLISDRIRVV